VDVTVADYEINQAAWNAAVAVAGGGEVWEDDGLRWSWQKHDGQGGRRLPAQVSNAKERLLRRPENRLSDDHLLAVERDGGTAV
jgi:hypothetical protein